MDRIKHIRNVLNNHPVRIIEPGGRTHASVALILEEQPSGLSILLIERETSEEIGLDLSTTQFLGRLDDIAPGGLKIVISCFVYAVNGHPFLRPDKSEIADAFWVPARELKNPARISSVEFIFRNRLRRFPALRVADDKEQPLWGITYNLLRNFNKVVLNAAKQNQRNNMEAHNVTRTKSK